MTHATTRHRKTGPDALKTGAPVVRSFDLPGSPQGGPEGVQTTTDNSSTIPVKVAFPAAVDSRWARLEWLRDSSQIPRQRSCMASSYSDRVQVREGKTGSGFGSVICCGSRCCPVCAPRVYGQNRLDIEQVVRAWRQGEGGTVLFGTLTVAHKLGDRFADLKAALSSCWASVTAGSGWLGDRKRNGIEHWVRVFEEKWSPVTGWHLHIHYLLFIAPGHQVNARRVLVRLFGRWRRAAIAAGMKAPSLRGQDLHAVTDTAAADVLGEYFAKQSGAEARTADQLAAELTMRDGKFTGESLTPGEVLTLAMAGDPHAGFLWAEYERGMVGRRVIAWSRGLRDRCGVGDELTDVQAAHVEGEELRRTVMEMRGAQYRKVVAFRRRRELLQRCWADGPEAAVAWLAGWGVEAVVGTLDAQEGDLVPDLDMSGIVLPF